MRKMLATLDTYVPQSFQTTNRAFQ
ncbi:protein of unknown function [Micropruina glycogenica]|uniref:Uncharacterized protein n=1 Tax=Micropruina glycogenica TaxID=75385 RepID=A0A2N9JE56_9ACTN|nr:protein of unknown function [Micropruina glycogenica]